MRLCVFVRLHSGCSEPACCEAVGKARVGLLPCACLMQQGRPGPDAIKPSTHHKYQNPVVGM